MEYNPKQTAKSTEEVIFQDFRNLIYNLLVMMQLWGIPEFFWPYVPNHYQNYNGDPHVHSVQGQTAESHFF